MIVMDRPQSLARLEKMAQKLKFNEIPFEVSLIYGLPLQTVDSFKRTVDFVNQKIKPNRIRAWPLMLLRGTKMYDMKGKYNLREKVLDGHLKPLDDLRQYNGIPHVISSSTFNENHWIQMKNFAQEFNSKDEL
jgi:coproporphyrinogen III oxidase-like Fe-S oxidoreductase